MSDPVFSSTNLEQNCAKQSSAQPDNMPDIQTKIQNDNNHKHLEVPDIQTKIQNDNNHKHLEEDLLSDFFESKIKSSICEQEQINQKLAQPTFCANDIQKIKDNLAKINKCNADQIYITFFPVCKNNSINDEICEFDGKMCNSCTKYYTAKTKTKKERLKLARELLPEFQNSILRAQFSMDKYRDADIKHCILLTITFKISDNLKSLADLIIKEGYSYKKAVKKLYVPRSDFLIENNIIK